MIVTRTWARAIAIVAAISSIGGNMLESVASTESSAEYLRKVMIELRDLNVPPSPVSVRANGQVYFDVDDKNFLAGKRYSSGKKIIQQVADQMDNSELKAPVLPTISNKLQPDALDQLFGESVTHNQYQVPALVAPPQKVIATEASGFTKADLAAVYNHALEKGSAVSLNALADALRHKQLPSVTTNQVKLAPVHPIQTLYFYPVKSVMNDVRHNVHSNVLPLMQPDLTPVNTEIMEGSQKEIANPLFMAVSGFIGMAVLFIIGILLIPRFSDFSVQRVSDDDKYLTLTKTIGEAIDERNCTKYPDIRNLDKRAVNRKPVKMARPSSVVLLTNNLKRQKDAMKKRRKNQKNCKKVPCRKSRVTPI